MSDFIEKYNQRASIDGHLRTVLYLFGGFLLPKINIHIKYLFFNNETKAQKNEKDLQLALLVKFSQLDKKDIENLIDFEGEMLVEKFKKEFDQGNRCVVCRDNGLASACWIALAPAYLQNREVVTYHISDCFTLPALRGRGMYPMILDFAMKSIQKESSDMKVRITVNSIFTNYSSIRGILKSGFNKAGIIFQFGKKGFAIFRSHDKWIMRFM